MMYQKLISFLTNNFGDGEELLRVIRCSNLRLITLDLTKTIDPGFYQESNVLKFKQKIMNKLFLSEIRSFIFDCDAKNIKPVFLKGLFTAADLYQKPDIRISTDIDILINAQELPFYSSIFEKNGYVVRDDFEEILKYLNNKVQISIITNGVLLSEKRIKMLEQYCIHNIQISLDGLSDQENYLRNINTRKILENIALLLSSKFNDRISIRTTVHRLNYKSLTPLFDYAAKYRLEIRLGYLDFVKDNQETNSFLLNKDEIVAFVGFINNYNLLNKANIEVPDISAGGVCGLADDALPLNLKINVHGDIFACQAAQTQEFFLGNIKAKSIVTASDNQSLLKLKNLIKMRKNIMGEKCSNCLVYKKCIGKCIANISNETGSIFNCVQRYKEAAEEMERN